MVNAKTMGVTLMSSRNGELDEEVLRFFLDEGERGDPESFWRKLREEGGPVYFSPSIGDWFINGYAEVHEGLEHYGKEVSVSPRNAPGYDPSDVGEFRQVQHDNIMFFLDPPAHGPNREIARKTFTGQSAENWRPVIRKWAEEVLQHLEPGASVDFVSDIAQPFPARLTAALFGLPLEDIPLLERYAEGFLGLLEPGYVGSLEPGLKAELEAAGNEAGRGASEYLAPIIERRLAGEAGTDDLLDKLIAAEGAGVITRYGISAIVLMLMVGGHDTLSGTLSNGIVAFEKSPEQWEALVKDPSLVGPAVEELLRYCNPLHLMGKRYLVADLKLGETRIPKGATLRFVMAAADRDPRNFEEPEKFDITRNPNRHVGFGRGIHFCLGSSFARVQLQEFLGALARKRVRLSSDPNTVEWGRGLVHWAPHHLPVTVAAI
jgi:cytochrome P450